MIHKLVNSHNRNELSSYVASWERFWGLRTKDIICKAIGHNEVFVDCATFCNNIKPQTHQYVVTPYYNCLT